MNLDQVLTVTEASKLLSVTIQHTSRLCRDGKITARQSEDGTWLILKQSVEAYILNRG